MTRRWLSVVGIGEDGLDGLAPAARTLVDSADVLVGGARHLDMAPDDDRERLTWPQGALTDLIPQLKDRRDRAVCVLATGDPMFYGIGVTIARFIAAEEMTVVPAPSAFSLACARLGWTMAGVETLTLHGRPPALVQSFIQPRARLLILSDGAETPDTVVAILRERGYGDSRLTVLEHMGGERERVVTGLARDWVASDIAPFNTLAVECVAGADAALLPRVPGLPDDAYRNDGQLTKREVRAATLAALGPTPDQLLWDIGAGAGSVAIEWMRAAQGARAIAFERNDARIKMIAENATALGAPGLEIVAGDVNETLAGHTAPSAVFLGGAVTNEAAFETCWAVLPTGGRLVANAVTLEGEVTLSERHAAHGGELVRIDVSHVTNIGSRRALKPRMAVTQWRVTKE